MAKLFSAKTLFNKHQIENAKWNLPKDELLTTQTENSQLMLVFSEALTEKKNLNWLMLMYALVAADLKMCSFSTEMVKEMLFMHFFPIMAKSAREYWEVIWDNLLRKFVYLNDGLGIMGSSPIKSLWYVSKVYALDRLVRPLITGCPSMMMPMSLGWWHT